jgi:hypothetical protein
MPLINRTHLDVNRLAPYWLPTESLGWVIDGISPELKSWFQNRITTSDYRPTLRKMFDDRTALGMLNTESSSANYLSVYLPDVDRLLVEHRQVSGQMCTRIYAADACGTWSLEYECTWFYSLTGHLRLPDWTCGIVNTDMSHCNLPHSVVYQFGDNPRSDASAETELQPVIEQHTVPHLFIGVSLTRVVRNDGAALLERYNEVNSIVELEWVGAVAIPAYLTHGWSYAQPKASPADNWLMLDPVHRHRESLRWCDYHQALAFIDRGWIPVTLMQLRKYHINPQEIDLNGSTLFIDDLIFDGSQPYPYGRNSTMPEIIPSISGTTPALNTISDGTGSTAVMMTTSLQAVVHPAENEFNTRIMQGDRMLDRLKHAMLVVTADRVERKHHIDLPTGTYPVEELAAARNTLSRFFNAIANSMDRVCVHTHDRYDDELMDRLLNMVADIQQDIEKRGRATDFCRQGIPYHSLPSTYRLMRDEVKTIVHEYISSVVAQSGYGEFAVRYACEHGQLQSVYDLRVRSLRQRISALLSEVTEDEIYCEELLSDYDLVRCDDCGDWELSDRVQEPAQTSDSVCRQCIDNHYTYSNYYDAYVHQDYARTAYDSDGDEVTIHCDDDDFAFSYDDDEYHHRSYDNRRHLIRDYHSAKRNDSFKFIESDWVKRNNRYMGVELEIECRDSKYDAVERLNNVLNDGDIGRRVWFENDGSLSSSGFEMITNPMGLDTHADLWAWLQDKNLTKSLRSHDTSTCGLHIHVSRNNLHDLQLNRINVFLNHPDNAALIKAVARRYATNYARIREKQMGKAHYAVDRYDALNLENDDTIEFRIFKGTLKHESLMAALEFTNAVVNFTNPGSPAGFNLSAERFVRFIATPAQRAETRYLRSYLKETGFMA